MPMLTVSNIQEVFKLSKRKILSSTLGFYFLNKIQTVILVEKKTKNTEKHDSITVRFHITVY